MSLAAAKAAIRSAALARRDRLDESFRSIAARRISARVLAAEGSLPPGPVSLYWPIRSEVATVELMHDLHAAGRSIALPVVQKPGLTFRAWRPGDALRLAAFGLSEPPETAPRVQPATMLVPLAAFDRHRNRIGYGAGFYDRAIADLSSLCCPRTIGLAFSVQEVDRVPVEAHDRVLDAIVTEDGVFGSMAETS